MTTVRKTITVTDQQDQWIAAQVQAGRFTNDSELIRDLIRREQERSIELEASRQALIAGERSGAPQPSDFAAFIERKDEPRRVSHEVGLRDTCEPARLRAPVRPEFTEPRRCCGNSPGCSTCRAG